jgi:WD40 repeat protein
MEVGEPVQSIAVSHKHKKLLLGGKDGAFYLCDIINGVSKQCDKRRSAITAIQLNADEKLALVVCHDHTARFWNVASGEPHGGELQHADSITAVAFQPAGRLVTTATRSGTVQLWDVRTTVSAGAPIITGEAVGLAISAKGHLRVITEDGNVFERQIPDPASGDSRQLQLLSQALTGTKLLDDGTVVALDEARWQAGQEILQRNRTSPVE